MNDQTTQLLRELAERLGTTTEHLWGVLVRQAPLSGLTHLFCWGIAATIFTLSFKRIRKIDNDEWDTPARSIATGIWAIGLLIFTCMLYSDSQMIIAAFFNPEFWALKQILK